MNPAYEHLRKLLNPPISLQIEDIVAAANQLQQEQMTNETFESADEEAAAIESESTDAEDSVDEAIPDVIQNVEKRKEYRRELLKLAWRQSPAEDWNIMYSLFLGADGSPSEANDIREQAKAALKTKKALISAIKNNEIVDRQDQKLKDARLQHPIFRDLIDLSINGALKNQLQKDVQNQERREYRNRTVPATQNRPIFEQTPHKSWELVIDETGSNYDGDDMLTASKFIGVLIPNGKKIKKLEVHGTDASISEVHKSFSRLLTEPDISVFGIQLKDIPRISGQQWIDGVCEVIAWVMRLLPLDGPTRLNVSIEQRSPYKAGLAINHLDRVILQALSRVSNERANLIQLNTKLVKKYNQDMINAGKLRPNETHRWLAFADIAAYMWGTTKAKYRKWFENSKLLHHSMHESLSTIHRNILDKFIADQPITGDLWNELLFSASQNPSHLVQWLNQQCLKRAQSDSKQWDILMKHTLDHLYSKGIYMPLLTLQAQWLEEAKSQRQQRLSLREELLFDTVRLATSNHQGKVLSIQDLAAFKHKKEQLIDEDARAACLMDLHLAVQLTHFFAFPHAKNLVSEWLKHPTALIGLNLKGRVESTIGQQFAFMGDNAKAVEHFSAAIDTFERLSTPSERLGEQGHTRSYKVIAMMDSGMHTSTEIEAEMLKLTSFGTMSDLCRMLSTNNDDNLKYVHHLFLRYIYLHKRTDLIEQYIDNKRRWSTGSHHPWGWINLYRALILAENGDASASRWFDTAIEGHRFSGIEMGIGIAFLALGLKQLQSSNEQCTEENIRKLMTDYAASNIAGSKFIPCLEKVLSGEYDNPRTWLSEALPFNFH